MSMSVHRWLALLAVPAVRTHVGTTPAMASTATPGASHAKAGGTEIIVADTPSSAGRWRWRCGPNKKNALNFISSDKPAELRLHHRVGQSSGCAAGRHLRGRSNEENAEWLAIPTSTNNGKPVAGPGVSQALLGRVYRKHVGWQVTYAGHRCTCSTGTRPGHRRGLVRARTAAAALARDLVADIRSGAPVPWAGTLTTTTIGGKTVLAEQYLTVAGWDNFPVYTFSDDQPYSEAARTGDPTCRCPGRRAHQWRARRFGRVRRRRQ